MPAGDQSESQGLSGKERQIGVFLSSTFWDMMRERDHLVTVVFRELPERVNQLGLKFYDEDMVCGITGKTADMATQQETARRCAAHFQGTRTQPSLSIIL